jgi:hypothetical protein
MTTITNSIVVVTVVSLDRREKHLKGVDPPLSMIWIRGGICCRFLIYDVLFKKAGPRSRGSEKIQRLVFAWNIILYTHDILYICNDGFFLVLIVFDVMERHPACLPRARTCLPTVRSPTLTFCGQKARVC